MYDTVICMGMHPIKTTTIACDTNILGNSYALAVYVNRKVYMDVIGILSCIAGDAINWWIGCVHGGICLDAQERKSHNTQQ